MKKGSNYSTLTLNNYTFQGVDDDPRCILNLNKSVFHLWTKSGTVLAPVGVKTV